MPPSVSTVEVIPPVAGLQESSASAVAWGPIVAGALTAGAATLILMLLGSGLGLSIVSPWSSQGASATTLAVSAAVWLIVVQWLSAALGGYLTGRLRTKWVNVHDDEVYFRDTAHGFLAWALATLLLVGLLGSALTSVIGGGVQATSTVVSGAALGASAGAAGKGQASAQGSDVTGYFVDALFRPANPAAASTQGPEGAAAATDEATRILLSSAASGEVSADDRTYLAQLVSARTGLSQADAEARVNAVLKRIDDAKAKAKEAADTARKAGLTTALIGALSLFIGAFIAAVAAAIGGRERDEKENLLVVG
ncbi:hypothetical protein [Pseudaminobacter soli (ex Li et al. 2025)]|uniref:PhnA-like protein n=1 Tax=Pseudaminobacter soli (ex Li et al. 2025) TaxID=1295366 RepID=A0A2P7S560_9HYPH|nr:hypothetical protein [Mesorhizobium soli]PSJ57572.1 hypothetical protein C7I85_21600 [Mesorhizobium soli]